MQMAGHLERDRAVSQLYAKYYLLKYKKELDELNELDPTLDRVKLTDWVGEMRICNPKSAYLIYKHIAPPEFQPKSNPKADE